MNGLDRLSHRRVVSYMLSGKHFRRWEMLLVVVVNDGVVPADLKVFASLSAAREHASQQLDAGNDGATIYEVDTEDARAAHAAIEMGEGKIVESLKPTAQQDHLKTFNRPPRPDEIEF
jgi:hypothetical protein